MVSIRWQCYRTTALTFTLEPRQLTGQFQSFPAITSH